MNARRSLEAAGATLLSAAAFAASAPNVQAVNYQNPNQNPANRLARHYVKQLGGRILNAAYQVRDGQAVIHRTRSGSADIRISLDSGQSLVAGSDGRYTLQAFASRVRGNLDRSDINNVRVAEGSAPSDGRPLFALRLFAPHPYANDPEGVSGIWYGAEGTAIVNSQRADFDAGTDPSRYAGPPGLVLDKAEVSAAGHAMDQVLDAALSGEPTQLIEPPFGPLQY